jgi:transposase-like protein
MSKTNPPYPVSFRAEAVALAQTSGKSIPVVARELGVSEQALRTWVKRTAIDAGQGPPGVLTSEERAELTRLRRQVRILEQEREILKKAAAFFAKETS